jgi:hypothetical protein
MCKAAHHALAVAGKSNIPAAPLYGPSRTKIPARMWFKHIQNAELSDNIGKFQEGIFRIGTKRVQSHRKAKV